MGEHLSTIQIVLSIGGAVFYPVASFFAVKIALAQHAKDIKRNADDIAEEKRLREKGDDDLGRRARWLEENHWSVPSSGPSRQSR